MLIDIDLEKVREYTKRLTCCELACDIIGNDICTEKQCTEHFIKKFGCAEHFIKKFESTSKPSETEYIVIENEDGECLTNVYDERRFTFKQLEELLTYGEWALSELTIYEVKEPVLEIKLNHKTEP